MFTVLLSSPLQVLQIAVWRAAGHREAAGIGAPWPGQWLWNVARPGLADRRTSRVPSPTPWARRAGWRDLGSEPCGGAPNIGEGRSSLVTDNVCRV